MSRKRKAKGYLFTPPDGAKYRYDEIVLRENRDPWADIRGGWVDGEVVHINEVHIYNCCLNGDSEAVLSDGRRVHITYQ